MEVLIHFQASIDKELFESLKGYRELAMIPFCRLFQGSHADDEICTKFEPTLTQAG